MKKLFYIPFIVFLCTLSVFAQESTETDIRAKLENIFSSDEIITELLAAGVIQRYTYKENTPLVLTPDTELGRDAVAYWQGEEPMYVNEQVYLYKKGSGHSTVPGDEIGRISVILRSVSKIEGITYYSNSKKREEVLYDKSFVVDNSDTGRKIADPVEGNADGLVLTVRQRDTTFGEYLYQYSYRQTEDTVALFYSNIDTMKYGFIKLIAPGELKVVLSVQDLGDYLLIYGLMRGRFASIPGIKDTVHKSFSSRVEAIYNWFIVQYEQQQ
ncbi:hypothetical protein K7I13_08530 [Brucepastera parasyntrophica]|uniref:DUF6675 family protein n=1 Tax=Brucepastera parasyntrophica TaxID=2880008 RepID=UPI00210D4AD7|nr:DUF6675 family protein [Brucepastera parasyntrophica]ULQ58610.1 hypothetical protein K7I13_08530 [Brucepastera parasyntrophica]